MKGVVKAVGTAVAIVTVSSLGSIAGSAHWVASAPAASAVATHQHLPGAAVRRAGTGTKAVDKTACVVFTDSTPDASDLAGSTNIDALDLTSGTVTSDGTNLIVTLKVINLNSFQGQPMSPAAYNATSAEWKFGWVDAKHHGQFVAASWFDATGATGTPVGWTFGGGYTTASPTGTLDSSDSKVAVTGTVDTVHGVITMTAKLSSFVFGDGTTSHAEPIATGDELTSDVGTTFYLLGTDNVGGFLETVDADQPTSDTFNSYRVGSGCTYA